jgi:hypothetical protein
MRQIPKIDEIPLTLHEHTLLDPHLHPNDLRLQILIDSALVLLYQLLYTLLPEDRHQLFLIAYLEILTIVVEELLQKRTSEQPDPVNFL